MGKFSDTKYVNTVESLVNATKDKLNNPYYVFSDRKPTKVTYYAQNIEKTTIDEASGLYGAHIGKESPVKFNKINGFLLYGIEKITTDYDAGDFGIEAASITGEGVVLPNTIYPRPGDFFKVDYIKEDILFKVNAVTPDTLDTGANIYKIEYALEVTEVKDSIEHQVVKVFNFVAGNVGTDFKCILEDCDYQMIATLEILIEELITYFENLFFNSKLQTFIFSHQGYYMYDPFMIEFLIRNKVLEYGEKYVYVSHAMETNATFSMDYLKTIFYSLENRSMRSCNCFATADMITDPNSLFVTRLPDYYWVRHVDNSPLKSRFQIINPEIIDRINSGESYEKGDSGEIYNLWVNFFNNSDNIINGDLLEMIRSMDYMDNIECFYCLGITIYILEQSINTLMK